MNSSLDPSACVRQWTSLPDEALTGETLCDWQRTEGTIHCLIIAYSLHYCFDLLCFCFDLGTLQTSCQRSVYVVDHVPCQNFNWIMYAIWQEGVSSLGRYIQCRYYWSRHTIQGVVPERLLHVQYIILFVMIGAFSIVRPSFPCHTCPLGHAYLLFILPVCLAKHVYVCVCVCVCVVCHTSFLLVSELGIYPMFSCLEMASS